MVWALGMAQPPPALGLELAWTPDSQDRQAGPAPVILPAPTSHSLSSYSLVVMLKGGGYFQARENQDSFQASLQLRQHFHFPGPTNPAALDPLVNVPGKLFTHLGSGNSTGKH